MNRLPAFYPPKAIVNLLFYVIHQLQPITSINMKKLLIALLAFGVLAVSCKKDLPKVNVNPDTTLKTVNVKKYKVTLTISPFSQKAGVIGLKTSTALMATNVPLLSDAFNKYYYIVYDETGAEIKRIIRTSNGGMAIYHHDGKDYGNREPGLEFLTTTAPFNVLTDSLAAGNYRIVVIGSSGEISINVDNTDDEDPVYLPIWNQATNGAPYSMRAAVYAAQGVDAIPRSVEIYFVRCNFNISNSDITDKLIISRVVGQLEVNLEDAIPNNVAYIQAGGIGEYEGYSFEYELPFGETIIGDNESYVDVTPNLITGADVGKTNYKLQRYIINTRIPVTIVLKAYDAANNLIVRKEINNVQFYKNRRTILSGKLFSTGPATSQFTITANQVWDPNPL